MCITRMLSPFIPTDENEAEMAEKAADGEDDDDDSSSSSSGGGAGGDDDDEGVITEIRFVPSDKAARK